jgi:quercetin dioxygenase-like cupin family protein
MDMDDRPYALFSNLIDEAPVPARGIHSQTLAKGDGVELVMFAFAAGEGLSSHTSARPAIIHVLSGEGEITLGGDEHPAGPGTWARMPARLEHAIRARTPMVMALYLLPADAAAS